MRLTLGAAPGLSTRHRQPGARPLLLALLLALTLLPSPRATVASDRPLSVPADRALAGSADVVLDQRGAAPGLFGIAGHAWWLDPHFDQFLALYRDLGI